MTLVEKKALNCDETPDNDLAGYALSSLMGLGAELIKYLSDITGTYAAGPDRPGKSKMNNTGVKMGDHLLESSSSKRQVRFLTSTILGSRSFFHTSIHVQCIFFCFCYIAVNH